MKIQTISGLLLAAVLALPQPAALAADVVVIVSARSSGPRLPPDQVADIYLGHASQFPDGSRAVALDQQVGSPVRDAFYAKVTARSPSLLKAYWSKMIFTGRGKPPRELDGSAAVRKAVADNPDMIGYIERAALDASVRPVLVVR